MIIFFLYVVVSDGNVMDSFNEEIDSCCVGNIGGMWLCDFFCID